MTKPTIEIEFDDKDINIEFYNWSPVPLGQLERAWIIVQQRAHQQRAKLLHKARVEERHNGQKVTTTS